MDDDSIVSIVGQQRKDEYTKKYKYRWSHGLGMRWNRNGLKEYWPEDP